MSNTHLVLNTEGYQVTFELKTIPDRPDAFDTTISFLLDPRLVPVAFKSVSAPITLDTFQRLVKYFKEHIEQIQINPSTESYTFVPTNLLFELQALAGEIETPDEGEFSLRFMLNMEQPEVDLTSIYVGGDAVITLENVNDFLFSIKQLIAETPH